MNRIYAAYRNWRLFRRTYRELMQLSPRELSDLGISRGEIPEIARQSFNG
jgi:uncharacterized protein YjiS (DUF1127 family)